MVGGCSDYVSKGCWFDGDRWLINDVGVLYFGANPNPYLDGEWDNLAGDCALWLD